MTSAGLRMRTARASDRDLLASFECSSSDPRVEPFIRSEALERHLRSTLRDDVRLLLFLDAADGLVAVSLHQRNQRAVAATTDDLVAGTELVVVAITDRFRDGRAAGGRPFVADVVEQTFADIRSRHRGDIVSMMVRRGNDDGREFVRRLEAELDGTTDGDDVFVLVLG